METLHMSASFACFLADERAHKEICGSKSASGNCACHCCQNCLGRIDPDKIPDGSAVVHFSCPAQPERLIPHTPATIGKLYEELSSQKDVLP